MKKFFDSLTFKVTLTMPFSTLMGWLAMALALSFQNYELLGVALFLFVISEGSSDDDQNPTGN